MHQRKHQHKVAGFTLIEVLVAVLVLSIGLLGLAGLQAASLRQNHSAYLRSQASLLAYDMLERMRGNRSEAVDGGDYDNKTFDELSDLPSTSGSPTLADSDVASWGTAVLALLPSASGSIGIDANDVVTISITWDDSRAQSTGQTIAGANTTTFTFRTRL